MALPGDFAVEVFAVVLQIPRGCVATYGDVARLVGMPGYARHVGHTLGQAPPEVPCHRVVNAAGRTAPGWSGQRALLETEGVRFRGNGTVDLKQCRWDVLL